MANKKFTGRNREAAAFLGEDPEKFVDPGFCLLCGKDECECGLPDEAFNWRPTMANKKFTGRNREAAAFLGEDPETFNDPGFCLLCGEDECECGLPDEAFCSVCFCLLEKCTCLGDVAARNGYGV